jgi:hypothetical protein
LTDLAESTSGNDRGNSLSAAFIADTNFSHMNDKGGCMSEVVEISHDDFFVKVVEMLQQNWAIIEPVSSTGVCVYFVSDTSGVFDEISFSSEVAAIAALKRNGFNRYADDLKLQSFLLPPLAPFHRYSHPNGLIYSSGRFWVE